MKRPARSWLGAVRVMLALLSGGMTPVVVGNTELLCANLPSEDTHRVAMALAFFVKAQLERGHPLTVFLNDKKVMIAAKAQTAKSVKPQKTLGLSIITAMEPIDYHCNGASGLSP